MYALLNMVKVLFVGIIFSLSPEGISSENMTLDRQMLEVVRHEDYISSIKLYNYLRKGADISARNSDGLSAIHLAAKYNTDPEVIEMLVAFGADINQRAVEPEEAEGNPLAGTPLYYALCYNHNYEVIETILRLQKKGNNYPPYLLISLAARNPDARVVTDLYRELLNRLLLATVADTGSIVVSGFLRP